jgi:predicted NBD/HSP70 family sugar kinase
MSASLAIDLGGTNLRAGLAAGDRVEPAALGRWGAPADLDALVARVDALAVDHGVTSAGVAVPGLVRGTTCLWVPNLPFLDGVDLAAVFASLRIVAGNDAQFALVAEAAAGAARDVGNAILIAVGTGIGSAVLADGRILRGEGGAAASFGWACADLEDAGDDAHGWLERVASGTALDRIAASLGAADGARLVGRARDGDTEALEALTAPMVALGTALAGAIALTGAQLVVFAGGVADGLDVLGPLLRPAIVRHLPPHLRGVRLVAGQFGARAALVGAGLAARRHPVWSGDGP